MTEGSQLGRGSYQENQARRHLCYFPLLLPCPWWRKKQSDEENKGLRKSRDRSDQRPSIWGMKTCSPTAGSRGSSELDGKVSCAIDQ